MEIILYVTRQMKGEDDMKLFPAGDTLSAFSVFPVFVVVFLCPDPKDAITFLDKTKEKVR